MKEYKEVLLEYIKDNKVYLGSHELLYLGVIYGYKYNLKYKNINLIFEEDKRYILDELKTYLETHSDLSILEEGNIYICFKDYIREQKRTEKSSCIIS